MDDFISKQAVIDTIRKIILGFFSEKDGVMTDTEKTLLSVSKAVCNGVRELPPAQPEKRTEERTETHACDCIERQAAIDELYKMLHDCFWADDEELDAVITTLNDLPSAQPEPHWIPCSEKYPDQDERVIVTIGGYDYFVWDCMSNRGDDYFWEDEHGFYHNKYEVLAWMPLPEPYKGERRTHEQSD